jgi:hypothetical protein
MMSHSKSVLLALLLAALQFWLFVGCSTDNGEGSSASSEDLRSPAQVTVLVGQQASLGQAATMQSMSFNVVTATGSLRLGIYDATGAGGSPGVLKAQTASFTPVVGWNTQNLTTPVALPAGTYWLAYLPSSSALAFEADFTTGSYWAAPYTFGAMPASFPTTGASGGTSHWALYASGAPSSGSSSGGGSDGGSSGGDSGSGGARDPLQQPFASTSIWNMPIGSGAVYVPANLTTNPPGSFFQGDLERISLTPTAPATTVYYNSAGWSGASRCSPSGGSGDGLPLQVPMPASWIVPDDGGNNGAAFLLADNQTVVQLQPLARCTAGGLATALLAPSQWTVSLYGDGIPGAHGGSGLSTLGGTIRIGELRPGQIGMKHALKLDLASPLELYHPSSAGDAYRWPALTADADWANYGTIAGPNNTNAAMKMGVLLAIPASTSIASLGLETEPGKQLAWTLQNYGAYDVDSYDGDQGTSLAAESGPNGDFPTQFQNDYGFAFLARDTDNSAWWRDLVRLRKALSAVDNNSPTSIGGGGTPLQPLAAPLP